MFFFIPAINEISEIRDSVGRWKSLNEAFFLFASGGKRKAHHFAHSQTNKQTNKQTRQTKTDVSTAEDETIRVPSRSKRQQNKPNNNKKNKNKTGRTARPVDRLIPVRPGLGVHGGGAYEDQCGLPIVVSGGRRRGRGRFRWSATRWPDGHHRITRSICGGGGVGGG